MRETLLTTIRRSLDTSIIGGGGGACAVLRTLASRVRRHYYPDELIFTRSNNRHYSRALATLPG